MGEAIRFYGMWARRTVWSAPGAADGYAGLAGTIIGLAAHFRPDVEQMTEGWIWQLPLWTLGAVLLLRFLATPYCLWREGGGIREQWRASRQRAHHATRYIEHLANEVAAGERPSLDQSAFKVCSEGIDRAMAVELPEKTIEPFEDIVYVLDRTRLVISEQLDMNELHELAKRAKSNQAVINAIIV